MDLWTQKQEAIGKQIESLVSNYRKDGASRKTLNYFRERQQKLLELWELFEQGDSQIREQFGDDQTHPYFAKRYYHLMRDAFQKYSAEFAENIEILQAQSEHKTMEQQPAVISREEAGLQKQVRRQQSVIGALKRVLQNALLVEQSRQYYELQGTTIQRYWDQIEEIHNNIWEASEDPAATGYNLEAYIQLEQQVQNTLVMIAEAIDSLSTQRPAATSNVRTHLPKITVPKFEGDYLQWQQFFDLFTQMVDNQPISPCEKM